MPRRKQTPADDWLPAQGAADIISEQSGHAVSADYVRKMGNAGRIEIWVVNSRLKLYKRSDVEKIRVKQHSKGD